MARKFALRIRKRIKSKEEKERYWHAHQNAKKTGGMSAEWLPSLGELGSVRIIRKPDPDWKKRAKRRKERLKEKGENWWRVLDARKKRKVESIANSEGITLKEALKITELPAIDRARRLYKMRKLKKG